MFQVSGTLEPMSRDLPRGDRPEHEEPPFVDPPDCPVCRDAGFPGYPLFRDGSGRWWCRRHQGFVDIEGPASES